MKLLQYPVGIIFPPYNGCIVCTPSEDLAFGSRIAYEVLHCIAFFICSFCHRSLFMEVLSSCNSSMDMELLLEAFGSSFSLETISSAYSQASRNVELAGVILYELQGTTAVSYESKDGMDAASTSSSNLISDGTSKYQYIAEESVTGLSVNNAISGISGGQHLKSTNASSKIHSFDMHSNKSLAASHSNTGKDDNMHADIEDFLFQMLGDGFQLDMKMIHEVLGELHI